MPTYLGKIGSTNFKLLKNSPGPDHRRSLRRQYSGYSRSILEADTHWLKTYANNLTSAQKERFIKLYRSGALVPEFVRHKLLGLRNVNCCPYCGMRANVTVDHYLPKDEFPQFSMLGMNLVPACSDCQNSRHKGSKYPRRKHRKSPSPDRFVHPYLDKFARTSVLSISFSVGEALTNIRVSARKGDSRYQRLVSYHVDALRLSERAHRDIDPVWRLILREVSGNAAYARRSELISMLEGRREEELVRAGSFNAIPVAFLSSLISSQEAIAFLVKKSLEPPRPHRNTRQRHWQ